MSMQASNMELLEKAGILKGEHFSGADQKVIEGLSSEEVAVLIKLREKMGASPEGKEHLRPNIVV
jgi:hypothetical protein